MLRSIVTAPPSSFKREITMKNNNILRCASLAAVFFTAAGVAHASVDPSPKPGGVFRLKPGVYVAKGETCEAPSDASVRQYDGKGIGTAHTSDCKAIVRARKGTRYTVDQACHAADPGVRPGRTVRQQIRVQDALTFTQTIAGASTTYRYCPVYQLPAALRSRAELK